MKYDKPLLITGCQRTGTTGLQLALSKVKGICVWFELGLYLPNEDIWARVTSKLKSPKQPKKSAKSELLKKCGPESSNYQVRNQLFDSAGKPKIYGDKLPLGYCRQMVEVMAEFPKAKIIFCMRDGRDVAASFARGRQKNAIKGAKMWLNTILKLEKDLQIVDKKRIMIVYMEDGAEDPKGLLKGIMKFRRMSKAATATACKNFAAAYKPEHIGAWKKECPNIEAKMGKDFVAALRRWGYK